MLKNEFLYPIVFSRIPVKRIWGGSFIAEVLEEENNNCNYGELWLLADRKEYQSIVLDGPLKGISLNSLWKTYKKEIFGLANSNTSTFPLLLKIIDAADDLSLQVHPKEIDIQYLKNAEAKTEMWYIINSSKDAKILAGFNSKISDISKELFVNLLNDPNKLKEYINHYNSCPNKYFFIPSGTIHSIGKGNIIFEIQQNSDTTYRVSDWGRTNNTGKSRDLHIADSLKSLNYYSYEVLNGIVDYKNSFVKKELTPINPYFKMYIYNLNKSTVINTFYCYKFLTLISGDVLIKVNNKSYHISKYYTVLLPIGCEFVLIPLTSQATLLSYY